MANPAGTHTHQFDIRLGASKPVTNLAGQSWTTRRMDMSLPNQKKKTASAGEDRAELARSMLPEAVAMVCSGRLCIHGKQTKMLPVMPE